MQDKKNILKNLDATCNDALVFLREKDLKVKGEEKAISEMDETIKFAESKGLPMEGLDEVMQKLRDSLTSTEMDEGDLMQEHIFMSKIVSELKQFDDATLPTYDKAKKDLEFQLSRKADIQKLNIAYEDQIKTIKEGESSKNLLRQDIMSNEEVIGIIDKEQAKFSKEWSGFDALSTEYATSRANKVINNDALEIKLHQLESELENKTLSFKSDYRNFVDARIELNASGKDIEEVDEAQGKYGLHNIQLIDLNGKQEDLLNALGGKEEVSIESDKEVKRLKAEIENLREVISRQNSEIQSIDAENNLLSLKNSSQKVKLESLEEKLRAWDERYSEFELLVDNLAQFVGFEPKTNYIGADGSTSGENPLIGLIERVKTISAWVESQDDFDPLPQTEENTNFSPLILGLFAVGGLLMLKS